MRITRRTLLTTAGAAMAGAILPVRAWSGTTLDLGGVRIDTLSDGNLVLPASFALGDIPQAEAAPVLAQLGLGVEEFTPPCNLTLLRDGERTVLFDAGSGPNFMPTAGKLQDAFDALGVSMDDVTHVVFTHAHPDHIWGLLDDFDEPAFYNAEFMIGQDEFDYWMDPATVDTIDPARQSFAVGAKNRLEVVADSIVTFGGDQEILPGIGSVATYGHTPGHMSFEIRAGGETVLVIGDAITNHHLNFARPGWHSGSDQDMDMGAATRVALLDRLASERMTMIGFHLPGGGIGRAERDGDDYRFVELG